MTCDHKRQGWIRIRRIVKGVKSWAWGCLDCRYIFVSDDEALLDDTIMFDDA